MSDELSEANTPRVDHDHLKHLEHSLTIAIKSKDTFLEEVFRLYRIFQIQMKNLNLIDFKLKEKDKQIADLHCHISELRHELTYKEIQIKEWKESRELGDYNKVNKP